MRTFLPVLRAVRAWRTFAGCTGKTVSTLEKTKVLTVFSILTLVFSIGSFVKTLAVRLPTDVGRHGFSCLFRRRDGGGDGSGGGHKKIHPAQLWPVGAGRNMIGSGVAFDDFRIASALRMLLRRRRARNRDRARLRGWRAVRNRIGRAYRRGRAAGFRCP